MGRAAAVIALCACACSAFSGASSVYEQQAEEAYRKADQDLAWLLQTQGEGLLRQEKELAGAIKALRVQLACARLNWRLFTRLAPAAPIRRYENPAAPAPSAEELRQVIGFLERQRQAFFSRNDRDLWDTVLFLETRASLYRLLGDRLLRDAAALRLAELKAARARGDLGGAIVALWRLRRFREVVLLSQKLSELTESDPEKKAEILRAVRGALLFEGLGSEELFGEIAAELRALGQKGEEAARPLISRFSFFIGPKAEQARVATVLGTVERTWHLTGRSKALLAYVGGCAALSAGDVRFALPLLRKAHALRVPGYLGAMIAGAVGICLESMGRYEEAAAAFLEARKRAEHRGNSRFAVNQTVNAVAAFVALNQYERAERILREALSSVTGTGEELWIRAALGTVKYLKACRIVSQGPAGGAAKRLLDDAEFLFLRTYSRLGQAESFPQKAYLKTVLLINLGNVKRRRAWAQPERRGALLREAHRYAKEALQEARAASLDRLAVIAGANRCEIALEREDLTEAEAFAKWSVEAARALHYFEALWRAEEYLGRIAEARGDLSAAITHYRRATEVIEQYRGFQCTEAFRLSFFTDKHRVYERLAGALLRSGKHGEAFRVAEQAKARTALEELGLKELLGAFGKDRPEVAELVGVLRRISLSQAPETLRQSAPLVAHAVDFETLREKLARLLGRVSGKGKHERALRYLLGDPPRPEVVSDGLAAGEVLLEYFPVGDRLAVWRIGRGCVAGKILPESWSRIKGAVERFVQGGVADPALSETLGRSLLAPLGELPPRVVIVPTGILHRVPFEALQVEGTLLLERCETRYLPSARLLLEGGGQAAGGVVAFADPFTDYDGDGEPDRRPLPFTRNEVEVLTELYPQAVSFSGVQATERKWYDTITGKALVHVACHGLFHPGDPWRSKLFLAPGGGCDGRVEAREIVGLDLEGAQLVTLSGCETGRVSAEKGDDVVGLPRSFLLAGASALVASLWPVEDRATSVLMKEFYRQIHRGLRLSAALRHAKLALRAHPRFGASRNWAAFVLFGYGGSISVVRPGASGTSPHTERTSSAVEKDGTYPIGPKRGRTGK